MTTININEIFTNTTIIYLPWSHVQQILFFAKILMIAVLILLLITYLTPVYRAITNINTVLKSTIAYMTTITINLLITICAVMIFITMVDENITSKMTGVNITYINEVYETVWSYDRFGKRSV